MTKITLPWDLKNKKHKLSFVPTSYRQPERERTDQGMHLFSRVLVVLLQWHIGSPTLLGKGSMLARACERRIE
jgi:hypothetical protein